MASLTYDNITAITRKYWLKKFPQLVYDQSILFKKLAAKGTKPESGASIMQSVMYKGLNGGSYDPFDTFDISGKEVFTSANWNWKYYQVGIVLSRDELLRNAGPEGVFKVMSSKMKLAQLTMHDNLATDAHALGSTGPTDSGTKLHCLDTMLDNVAHSLATPTPYTYGGIVRETGKEWWSGEVKDGGGNGANVDYTDLNVLWGQVVDGSIHPNLGLMHNQMYASFIAQQQAQQRYIKQDIMDIGFMSFEFNGIPVVADRHVSDTGTTTEASNRIYLLNTDFIDLVVHRDENFRLEPFAKPVDQAVIVGHVMWAGELTCSDPSRSAVMENFDSTAVA